MSKFLDNREDHDLSGVSSMNTITNTSQSEKPVVEDIEALEVVRTVSSGSTAPAPAPDVDFPEGGKWGWLSLAGATLVQFCTFGYTNAFGVYQDYYVRVYLKDYTALQIGWIGGIQILFIFSMGIFTGRAVDRGYFHHLMISGSILHALALFMLSLSNENKYYQVFLAQGVCLGLSCGLTYIPSLAISSHYFKNRRPLTMGIVAGGSALGSIIHPIALNRLFSNPAIGFHNGVRISASLNTVLLIIANFIMRTRLPPKPAGGVAVPIKEFCRDSAYVFKVMGSWFVFLGLFFPVFFLQLDAIQHGIKKEFAFYLISILNAASLFGRTLPSAVVPKFGVFNLLSFFVIGTGIVTLTMAVPKDIAGFAIFAIFYGFFSGAAIGLTPPALATLSRDVNEIGVRIGLDFSLCGILGLFATPIGGELLTRDYHWIRPILFAGLGMITGGFLILVSRFIVAKRKGSQWV